MTAMALDFTGAIVTAAWVIVLGVLAVIQKVYEIAI